MELNEETEAKRERYLSEYAGLLGDKRMRATFGAVVEGIISGKSLCAAAIARFSP